MDLLTLCFGFVLNLLVPANGSYLPPPKSEPKVQCVTPRIQRFVTSSIYHTPVITVTKTVPITNTISVRTTITNTVTAIETAYNTQSIVKPTTVTVTDYHTKVVINPGAVIHKTDTARAVSVVYVTSFAYKHSTTTVAHTETKKQIVTLSVQQVIPRMVTVTHTNTVSIAPRRLAVTAYVTETKTVGAAPRFTTFYDTVTATSTYTKVNIAKAQTVTKTEAVTSEVRVYVTSTQYATRINLAHQIRTRTVTLDREITSTETATVRQTVTSVHHFNKVQKVILSTTLTNLQTVFATQTLTRTQTITQTTEVPYAQYGYGQEIRIPKTEYLDIMPSTTSTIFVTGSCTSGY